mgnify:CR=1 FL=1
MIRILFNALIFFSILSCQSQEQSPALQLGAERIDAYLDLLKGKRVALVVNQTSMIGQTHLVDSLHSLGVNINKVMAPEHGFRGEAPDGETIDDSRDERTGISIVSIYGKTKKPSPEMLEDVDVLVFDIQEVGIRIYTFISTML